MSRPLLKSSQDAVAKAVNLARLFADAEAIYCYEGTYQMQNLIVGKAITGHGAFV
jgi:alkylation response protein AidB-like acyl-CoA dehydrogenase